MRLVKACRENHESAAGVCAGGFFCLASVSYRAQGQDARVLVGRDRELAELRAAVKLAAVASGRLFLLGDEPGIG